MKMEKVTEAIGQGFIKAFELLSSDPGGIFQKAQSYSLSEWRHRQEGLAGGAGGVAAIVPGLHIPALGLDIGYLVNRMGECCYGIGTILGLRSGKGNILEQEDLANILALWSGAITVDEIDRVVKESRGAKFGGTVAGPVLGKTAAVSLGVLKKTTGSLTPMVASKIAAKMGAKIAAKTMAGWIPYAGALASGGINVWLVSSVSITAEEYYTWKATHSWRPFKNS